MLKLSIAPLGVACALLFSACVSLGPPSQTPACEISAEDEAWIIRSVEAWRFASREFGEFAAPAEMQSVFFDDDCVWLSRNALGGAGEPTWTVTPHVGVVTLPDGGEMPVGVTSFTTSDGEGNDFFVMATPSVWQEGGVSGGPLGLPTLLSAVLIHESSHVTQIPTYGVRIGALSDANGLPEDFSDDSMQRRFESDEAFATSIVRETELLLAAAATANDSEARRLAREARAMMVARADRYFVGENAYWREAEDVWLTFEGSAQWLAYQWVTSPDGANVAAGDAMPGFGQRSRWWSQKQGFALFMALDRLDDGAWRATVFGGGDRTALELLDAALAG